MGTKPAKLGRLQSLGVNSAKLRRFCATKTPPPPPLFPGLRSVGGPKLLKWGLSHRARVKSAKARPTPYVYDPRVKPGRALAAHRTPVLRRVSAPVASVCQPC